MTSLSDTALMAIAMLLMVVALFLATRLRRKKRIPPPEPKTLNSSAVQQFFAEVAADEKLFGIEHKEPKADKLQKAERLRAIEALVASPAYLSLTDEQREVQVKLLADESVVRLVQDTLTLSKENERIIDELRVRRKQEALAFLEAQRQRDADIARLHELERKAQANGYQDTALIADIEKLKRRMATSRYMAVEQTE
jgi:hypothetical protein